MAVTDEEKAILMRALAREETELKDALARRERAEQDVSTHQRKVTALREILGPESAEASIVIDGKAHSIMWARNPTLGSVTDGIRILLEQNPKITANDAVARIREKFPQSNITSFSFAVWNGYFKHGRYRMDRDKYKQRFGTEPPYA